MKRWAIYTVLLYALAILLLTMPLIMAAFGSWGFKSGVGVADAAKAFINPYYWAWLMILLAGQFLLLLVPIDISERRLPARRKLKAPVIVTGFFLANLTFAGLIALLCAAGGDEGCNIFDFTRWFVPTETPRSPHSDAATASAMIFTALMFWLVWGLIFQRASKLDSPGSLMQRATQWLLRGSILELIIAVPSHVIVRRRDDCCAPAGTFWGIATGISVMLLCFGPGVFYLFVARMNKMKPKTDDLAEK
jgi:hypothetical protein